MHLIEYGPKQNGNHTQFKYHQQFVGHNVHHTVGEFPIAKII